MRACDVVVDPLAVPLWLARRDVMPQHRPLLLPAQDRVRRQLGTVVADVRHWPTANKAVPERQSHPDERPPAFHQGSAPRRLLLAADVPTERLDLHRRYR